MFFARPANCPRTLVPGSLVIVIVAALLSGCVRIPAPTPPLGASAPIASRTLSQNRPGVTDHEALAAVSVSTLEPERGLDDTNVGQRVRWAGPIQNGAASGKGVCLTILYVPSDEHGVPRWNAATTGERFTACSTAAYDPDLVGPTAFVTVVGRIERWNGDEAPAGPVIQIEKLFRWSDCLQGDTDPACRSGFIEPGPIRRD